MNEISSGVASGDAGQAHAPSKKPPSALDETATLRLLGQKGLLAMDESNPTCNSRFARYGIPQTSEARRTYRELIVTTPGLGDSISGAILYDETIRQRLTDGTPFAVAIARRGMIPGIKVDVGAKAMAGCPSEKVTEGLDGLRLHRGQRSCPGSVRTRCSAAARRGEYEESA
jgi:fructose-bisphosphate aldolase class 1